MSVFVDTSAFFAILDCDDANHPRAREKWLNLLSSAPILVCSNYVLVESFALIQRRLGIQALRVFQEDILPLVNVERIDETTHLAGVTGLLAAARRELSLVDCTSFVVMRKLGIKDAFTYNSHFAEEGFNCLT
jgi:predicted nucleic acid-binding protein